MFRWTKEMAYADYYERALTNGVLSIQRGKEPGIMIYMLPLGTGVSKATGYHKWGSKFNDFWCCYGTGSFISYLFGIQFQRLFGCKLTEFNSSYMEFMFLSSVSSLEGIQYHSFSYLLKDRNTPI